MNSRDPNFEWHVNGVYVALGPDNGVYIDTAETTAHGARASLMRRINKPWSKLQELGWTIQGYVIPDAPADVRVSEQVATAPTSRWHYPANGEPAPAGVTVHLLTRGRVVVRGVWNDMGDYIAWAPMLQRDKELEARLGL